MSLPFKWFGLYWFIAWLLGLISGIILANEPSYDRLMDPNGNPIQLKVNIK